MVEDGLIAKYGALGLASADYTEEQRQDEEREMAIMEKGRELACEIEEVDNELGYMRAILVLWNIRLLFWAHFLAWCVGVFSTLPGRGGNWM